MALELIFEDGSGWELVCRALTTGRERLGGLLGTDAGARPVALVNCSSIHTLGMRYAIDVAFVSGNGHVIASRRAVPPSRLVGARGAKYVLERPATKRHWPQAGDTLLATVREEREGRE